MPEISLKRVDSSPGEPRLNVIFVHGLGGDPVTTWCHKGGENDGYFWLKDIAEDVEGAAVYTLGYPGDKAAWNPGWPIAEAAVAIFDKLMNSRALRVSKSAPIAFVCHSLGGIIIKKLVVTAHLDRGQQPAKGEFLDRIAGVVFLATPHDGSIIARIAKNAYWFVSKSLGDLAADDAALLELGHFYRDRIANEEVVIRHRVYYEKLGMWGTKVVTAASADPGLPGVQPIPVNRDHMNICKPESKDGVYDDPVYEGVVAFLQDEVLQLRERNQNEKLEVILRQTEELTALTRRLLENSTVAPAPGAEQRVAAVVGSIARRAAEGDSRLQQALELLKANKTTEAEPLLTAFAEDKKARIDKDRKEAAIAYRNLGAIAGLADPKRALEAYEKALALDPDDLESLLGAGWIQIDYGDLNKARARLERVLTLAKTSALAFYRYGAFIALGDIKQRRGDLASALDSYRDTLAIAERLAKSDPGDANWQRELAVALSKIGDVQNAQCDHTGALKSYNDGLAIFEQLAKVEPGNAKWQRDLSVSYDRVGNVRFVKGEFAGALKSFLDGLAIAERQAIADSGNASRQRELSLYYQRVGDVQLVGRDFAAALKSYRDSLAIIDRLAKSDQDNAGWQRDLSVAFNKIGDVQKAQDDLAGALKSYNDGLAIINRLAISDLRDAVWQRDLSVSYIKVSDLQEAQGDLAGALNSYNDGLAIINRLAQSDPGNAEWQQDLAASFFKIAKLHFQSGDNEKALEFLRQAQAIVSRLTKLSPDNAMWKQELTLIDRLIAELAAR